MDGWTEEWAGNLISPTSRLSCEVDHLFPTVPPYVSMCKLLVSCWLFVYSLLSALSQHSSRSFRLSLTQALLYCAMSSKIWTHTQRCLHTDTNTSLYTQTLSLSHTHTHTVYTYLSVTKCVTYPLLYPKNLPWYYSTFWVNYWADISGNRDFFLSATILALLMCFTRDTSEGQEQGLRCLC